MEMLKFNFFSLLTIILISDKLFQSISAKEDPDAYLSAQAIIRKHGYPSETHIVVTDDGFILHVLRIPFGNNSTHAIERKRRRRQPVFLQHGLIADSSCFLISKEKSLPFILANHGYDVWLGNARGTLYSRSHVKYTPSDNKFWDWSWDEMGDYDVPKVLEYISKRTNQTGNILYIGHSMGTTMFFASMASKPENKRFVKAMFALAPVAYTEYLKGPLRAFGLMANNIESIYELIGFNEFIPENEMFRYMVQKWCEMQKIVAELCENTMFIFAGFDQDQLDTNQIPVIFGHIPSSTSVRSVMHYGQQIGPGTFQRYDFGKEENLKRYGSTQPPQYNISNIDVPIALYHSKNDWLAQEPDVDRLWIQLPNKISKYIVPLEKFNHIDFIWAKDSEKLLFNQLISDLKKYSI